MKKVMTFFGVFSFFLQGIVAGNEMVEVGEKAPAFELKNTDGEILSLEKQVKEGPLVLVFYRSGDWWKYCKTQLVELQKGVSQISETGTVVWAVSYDSAKKASATQKELKLTYPILSDEGSKVIDTYGVRNLKQNGSKIEGVAIPMTLIIDKDGVVKAKLAHDGFRKRHGVEAILAELKKL